MTTGSGCSTVECATVIIDQIPVFSQAAFSLLKGNYSVWHDGKKIIKMGHMTSPNEVIKATYYC